MADYDEQGPNPLTVQQASAPTRPDSGSGASDSWFELNIALAVAFIPLILDIIVRSLYSAVLVVDVSTLAYAALAVTFAAVVRILSRGEGRNFLGLLLAFSFTQAILALIYSGALHDSAAIKKEDLQQIADYRPGQTLDSGQIGVIRDALSVLDGGRPESNIAAYWILWPTGAISLLILIQYWLPYSGIEILRGKSTRQADNG